MNKALYAMFLATFFSYHVHAQNTVGNPSANIYNRTDSVIVFRFNGTNNMFYRMGNEKSLSAFGKIIQSNRQKLTDKSAMIDVNGFCSAFNTQEENLQAVKVRSNQVKSYYITNYGLKSDNFSTLNISGMYHGQGNVVAIALTSTAVTNDNPLGLTPEQIYQEESEANWTQVLPPDTIANVSDTISTEADSTATDIVMEEISVKSRPHFAISTNALYWAALLPNGGISYRFAKQWAVNTSGGYTWWSFSKGKKTYYLWEVAPSISFFLSKAKNWRGHYFSAYWHIGKYDIKMKNDERGHQGDYWGAGLEYGYIFRIAKHFDLSLFLRGGYIQSNYKAYTSDYLPCYNYLYSNDKHLFSLTGAGVCFIWRIGDTK